MSSPPYGESASIDEALSQADTRTASTNTSLSESSPPSKSLLRRWTYSLGRPKTVVDAEQGVRGELGLQLLHASPEPLVDVIFVHGLRGGSVKTWRKGDDPALFWPKAWLPYEKGFEHASIYSFGYDSDWFTATRRILNVHNFGMELFEVMRSSHHLRDSPNTPIVLVGHSMGGLVIKKAFILAHHDKTSSLASRIRCIFFLATPHRGSDYAGMLKNILAVSGVPKEYVHDLTKGSSSTEIINEDFVRFLDGVSLFSFYETLPMKIGGVSSGLIVDKHSAVLEYKNERRNLMIANHRDICKFNNPDDPNYIKVRDSLGSAIDDLLRHVVLQKQQEAREHLRILRAVLGIQGQPDDFSDKVEGSCEWINDREDFKEWRDSRIDISTKDGGRDPALYWVSANPGTGKTVLAGHVVSHLQECNMQCAYYYFHKENRTLGGFLRSIAYQMARSNAAIRDMLLRAHQDGLTFDQDDSRTIWAKLFRGCIFQASIFNTQYWVIDAVDECSKYNELFTILKADKPKFSLRILLTSRKIPEIRRLLNPFEAQLTSINIPINDTMHDIARYINSRTNELIVESYGEKKRLMQEILDKSSGSFLWVRLVLDELRMLTATESMIEVLSGIPKGMTPYYERIVARMAENEREKHIAKAILRWVVSAARPLSTLDLSEALELETKTSFPSISAAIEGLCGQLVYIDKQTDLVHIVHATAREFLVSESAGEFMITKSAAHERIALTCLQLLCGRSLAPPRHRRLLTDKKPLSDGLLKYALSHFSEHVHGAPSDSVKVVTELDRFLKSNILTWIELQATRGDLHGLIRVAKDLTAYLERRAKHVSPLNEHAQVRTVEGWSVSLSRLATKFGKALLASPSSIYFLIPPLCPTNTVVHKFGKSPDGLTLLGSKTSDWDDCIATIDFEDRTAAAVACGETHIAVGMERGDVLMYHHRSFQHERTLLTKYPIDIIHFLEPTRFVAGCSSKFLTLWNLKGEIVWQTRVRSRCLYLVSTSTELIGITESGRCLTWDLVSGKLLEEHAFPYQQPDEEDEIGIDYRSVPSRAPGFVSMSPDMEVLALGYRTGPVCLWDFKQKEFIGWAMDENNGVANHILFNPNPNVSLLLVAYGGSPLALYDSWSGYLIQYTDPDLGKHTNYASVASSPNGSTLATVDVMGTLRVLDFESLAILYQVQTPALSFRNLTFTSDGANIVDVTDNDMRIWSPATLVRKNIDEEASTSETDLAALTVVEGQYESVRGAKISAVCAHPSRCVVFASNNQGEVMVYHAKTGFKSSMLYKHPHQSYVKLVAASGTDLVASCDVNSIVQIWKLDLANHAAVRASTMTAQLRLQEPIRQLMFSPSGKFILVSTTDSDHVYSTQDGSLVGSHEITHGDRWAWIWLTSDKLSAVDEFILVVNCRLWRYSAAEFPALTTKSHISIDYSLGDGCISTGFDSAMFHADTQTLLLSVRHQAGHASNSNLNLYRLPEISLQQEHESKSTVLRPFAHLLPSECDRFIGVSKHHKSVIFLHADSWISSIELKRDGIPGEYSQYTRHFFVPWEFTRRADEIPPVRTCDDDIVFCLHGDLAVVKNGLKFQALQPLR